ncbi:MAG: hypothetical protein ACYCSW_05365 [bacterium]
MKKLILFLILSVILMSTILTGTAFAKVFYNTKIMSSALTNKQIENQIGYLIYHDKKLTNIQRAVQSKNRYSFVISVISRQYDQIYFTTASIFIFKNDNMSTSWSGVYNTPITIRKIRRIEPKNRSLKWGEQFSTYLLLNNVMKSVNKNKYYRIWR